MKSIALFGACAVLAVSTAAAAQTAPAAATAKPAAAPVAEAAKPATAHSTAAASTPAAQTDVIEAMRAQGQFATLLKALDAANLTERLKASPGITVFAPTDAAFAALPAGTMDKLLQPQNAAELRKVLLYHTVNSKVAPAQLANQKGMVKTGADAELTLDGAGGRIMADEATVTADIPASNGVVFAIDKVIAPADVKLGAGVN